MSIDSGWIVLVLLGVFLAWLGGTVWRAGLRRRRPADAVADTDADTNADTNADADVDAVTASAQGKATSPAPPEPRSVAVAAASKAAPAGADDALAQSLLRAETAQRADPAARAPARPAAPAAVAAAPPLANAAAAAKTVRPQAPRFERVLGIEAASAAAWQSASPLELQPAQARAVLALCGRALDAARDEPAHNGPILALTFAPGTLLRIARGDAPMLKALAADNDASTLRVLGWLDSHAASALAATLLAALAAARHLDALGTELPALRKEIAALPTSASAAGAVGEPLAAVADDLWRLQRGLRGNHAAAVAKPACREQVQQVVDHAGALWRDLHARLDAARGELAAAAGARAPGADQLDRLLAGLRTRGELQAGQQFAGRALAAAWLLRTTLGGARAPAGVHPLQSAAAALRAGAALDRALAKQLAAAVERRPGEDEDPVIAPMRRAVAEAIETLAAEAEPWEGIDRLASAYAAGAEGFPDGSGGDDRWLVRAAAGPGAVEVRRAGPARLH